MRTQQAEREDRLRRRWVIYCRISDDREGRKYGVKRQERDCRRLKETLERQGIPGDIVAVLIENDTSAYSGKPRPKYNRLLEMLRADEADGVLALTSRRLQRRYREAFDFLELVEEKDILVATVKGGTYDLTTADGRREARRKAIDDQHEAEEISERIRDAKGDNVREGTYRGGPRPFGYEADGVTPRSLLCPDCGSTESFSVEHICSACEATETFTAERCTACGATDGFTVKCVCDECGTDAVIAEGSEAWYAEKATDAVIAGDSLRSICRDWAEKGIRTVPRRKRLEDGTRTEPRSKEWQPPELRRMLLRPRNAGLLEVGGEIVGQAAWPTIVPEEKWRACKDILEHPDRRTTTGNGRKWLGSGLYRCGVLETRYQVSDGREFVHTGEFTEDDWPLYAKAGADPSAGTPVTAHQLRETFGKLTVVEAAPAPKGKFGCRETMRCSTSGTGSGHEHLPSYRCRSGKHVTRIAASLDDYVEGVIVERLSRRDAVALFLPPPEEGEPTEKLAAKANALRTKLDGYTEDYDNDLITRKQMLDGTARTRAKLKKVEAEMARRATVPVLKKVPLGTPEVAEHWKGYSLDRKRAIIDAVMTVVVLPAPRGRRKGFRPDNGDSYFDPNAVRIDWHGRDRSHLSVAK